MTNPTIVPIIFFSLYYLLQPEPLYFGCFQDLKIHLMSICLIIMKMIINTSEILLWDSL